MQQAMDPAHNTNELVFRAKVDHTIMKKNLQSIFIKKGQKVICNKKRTICKFNNKQVDVDLINFTMTNSQEGIWNNFDGDTCGTFDGFALWSWNQFADFINKYAENPLKNGEALPQIGIYEWQFVPPHWKVGIDINAINTKTTPFTDKRR